MRWLSLSGLRWAKKTGIFILGTLTLMTVGLDTLLKKKKLSIFPTKRHLVLLQSYISDLFAPKPFTEVSFEKEKII